MGAEATDPTAEDGVEGPRSRLFTVRVWTEEGDAGTGQRGSVRDVVSGAYRHFHDWPDLTSFIAEQVRSGRPVGKDA